MKIVIAPARPGVATVAQKFTVDGMTCSHCVEAVTAEVSRLRGCTDVRIDLATATVITESETTLDPEAVADAVTRSGYQLVSPAPARAAA